MRCPHCNSRLKANNKFCPECGLTVARENEEDSKRSGANRHGTLLMMVIVLVAVIFAAATTFLFNRMNYYKSLAAVHETVTQEKAEPELSFPDDPEAIALAAKSVVKLNCYDSNGNLIATGSGFCAFEEGTILTNYHVIEEKPSRIEIVTENGESADVFGAIGADVERDIALLYYKHRNAEFQLSPLPIGSSEILTKGEKVVAIGCPLGLTNVVSLGMFSGFVQAEDTVDIQFTAAISSGSSGGALLNALGEVIGITYASLENGQNLNLAVPIEFVESLWKVESKDRTSLANFYDSLVPHYTIEYVLENYKDLEMESFYLDCWVSSYGEIKDTFTAYCVDSYDSIFNPEENIPDVRFAADKKRYSKSDMLKAVHYGDSFWVSSLFSAVIGRDELESIKCAGVQWSAAENRPYVIIE